MGVVKSIAMTYSDKEYLLWYIERNDFENVEKLLTKRPELMFAKLTQNTKMTPLFRAAYNGNLQMVKFLIQKCKAEVNDPTELGQTPLIAAVKRNHLKVVRYLLQHNANANFTSSIGLSTIEYAILPGYYETSMLLFQKCKNKQFRSIEEYAQLAENYSYRYVNYEIFLDCLQKMIEPENVPNYLKKIKLHLKDPVVDPRETWGHWFKRNMDFKDPPLCERDDLPLQLQPQNRKFGKIKHFFSRMAISKLSQKPQFYPKSKSVLAQSQNQIKGHNMNTNEEIEIRTIS